MVFIMVEGDSTHRNTSLRDNMRMALEQKVISRLMILSIKVLSAKIFTTDTEF
jgi:hypothetical protein